MAGQLKFKPGDVNVTLPPPRERVKRPTSGCGSALGGVLLLAALGFGGWWGYNYMFVGAGKASIDAVTLDRTRPHAASLLVNLTFHGNPSSGDITSVVLQVESSAWPTPVTLDWDAIAGQQSRKVSKFEPPPLGATVPVRVPTGTDTKALEGKKIVVKLSWAGKQQDRMEVTLGSEKPASP